MKNVHCFPEYTVSLLIWIIPCFLFGLFFIRKRLFTPEKIFGLCLAVALFGSVGSMLDLLFAHYFFTFPNPAMVLGLRFRGIPLEEFVFYLSGFLFVVFLYMFCDECFLRKHSIDDQYARYRFRLRTMIVPRLGALALLVIFLAAGFLVKRFFNPQGHAVPGYFWFLTIAAYFPGILFYPVTRPFVNWRAYLVTLFVTVPVSVVWEAALALPRGYWGYQSGSMLGLFIGKGHAVPVEASSVWFACTVAILVYEFLKFCYVTKLPSLAKNRFPLTIIRD
jgi:hypothetical protein